MENFKKSAGITTNTSTFILIFILNNDLYQLS